MMPPAIGGAALGGLAQAQARVGEIEARIGQLTGGATRGRGASFALPEDAVRAGGATGAGTAARVETASRGTSAQPLAISAAVDAPWARRLPAEAGPWVADIQRAAERAGLDPALLAAVVRHESNFDPDAVSHAGAIGLTQLMPGTADALGVDPHDPQQNLDGGARFLKEQLDRFGTPDLALAAYNAGPNRVLQAGGVPQITETQAYVARVLTTWEQLR